MGLIVGLSLLFPAAAMTPVPAQAASCTDWDSTTVPPNSIRVLRSNSGNVETVDFRHYVLVVMGKEWGSYLPMELLEAGAQAVKQFAWYHVLHWRGGTADGRCFDVRDTTTDQLYRPEAVEIADKHRTAVNAIWGLSLRKSGRFILTPYRRGSDVGCADDVDGKRLYAISGRRCANAGWSSQRILSTYYSPDLSFTWSDTGPDSSDSSGTLNATVTTPRSSLRTGAAVNGAPVVVSWQPSSGADSIRGYQVQRYAGGEWKTVSRQTASDTDFAANFRWGSTRRFRVRASDGAGRTGPWSAGPTFSPRRADDRNSAVRWSGSWQRTSDSGAVNDTTTTSTQAGASAAFSFTGRALAVVATRGPSRGQARIYINGTLAKNVDLYASSKRAGTIVYSRSWRRVASRTVRVVVVGTSSRPRVDIDAFLYLR